VRGARRARPPGVARRPSAADRILAAGGIVVGAGIEAEERENEGESVHVFLLWRAPVSGARVEAG